MFRARTAQNVAILVGLSWLSQLLQIATKVILARLLFPSDFGIYALAAGLISFIGTFGNFGLNYAIIQKGDAATKEDFDVAMTIRIIIAVGLFGASIAVAGLWASLFPLFPASLVVATTQIAALVYLITPWSFVPSTRLTLDLRFRAQIMPTIAGQLATAIVSIALAFLGFGVWSLIIGYVLGQAASVIGFNVALRWRFRLSLRLAVAVRLLRYGKHLIFAAILGFLITNIDNFAVGAFLGSAALGFYVIAWGLGFIPVALVSGPAGTALFPSLAKIQDSIESIRGGYLESFGYAVAIIAPASIGLAVTAPELVSIVLGPRWIAATAALSILAFYGLAQALVVFSSSLFQAVGRPKIVAELNLYILLLSLVPLVPLTLLYNIVGTAVAMTVPVALVGGFAMHRTAGVLRCRTFDVLRRGKGPFAASAAMGAAIVAVREGLYWVLPERIALPVVGLSMAAATSVFLLAVPLGMVVYFALLRILDREMFDGLWRHLRMALRLTPAELTSDRQ